MNSSSMHLIDELEKRFDQHFSQLQLQRTADLEESCALFQARVDQGL